MTIKSSKGGLAVDRIQLSPLNAIGGANFEILQIPNDAAFVGTNITITAKPQKGAAGDGLVHVGAFTGDMLGSVKIAGDLGTYFSEQTKSLTVHSIGLFRSPSDPTPHVQANSLGALTVKTSVVDSQLTIPRLGKATIGGSMLNTTLLAVTAGAVKIGGDLGGSHFFLLGDPNPTAKQAVTLKSLSVGGDVRGSDLLIGEFLNDAATLDSMPFNPDVQVGAVAVKGSWTASNLIVGTDPGADGRFGTGDDVVTTPTTGALAGMAGGNAIVASIKSVSIGGLAVGDTGLGSFGIVAEQIGALKIGKTKTAPDALPLLLTGDFFAREIGAPDPVLAALSNANASVGPAVIELSSLTGANGFKLQGEAAGDRSGVSVSGAGDVNGDGFADLIVGAFGADPNGGDSGACYVVFGCGTGVATVSADGKTATWLDVDGDLVTLKSSTGGLTAERLHLSTPNALGGSRLVSADFTDPAFAGSNISLTAKPQKGLPGASDGLVTVGSIFAGANALGSVTIAGDLAQLDAAAVKALAVHSLGLFPVATKGAPATSELASLGALTVKTGWQSVDLSVTGTLGKATIGGAVREASLAVGTQSGAVKIGGDLRDAQFLIAGLANPTPKQALALKSLALGGSMISSQLLLGYNAKGSPVNPDVQAGKVAIKGNFLASNLVAGITPGTDDFFGDGNDALIGGGTIVSRIAAITIGGSAFGTSGGTDHFGIVAQQIGALKVGKAKATLSKTALDVLELGTTGDLTAREVA